MNDGSAVIPQDIKSNREVWGKDPEIGWEWDAGTIPMGRIGRVSVRRTANTYEVYFRNFAAASDEIFATFPASEIGEIEAKHAARAKFSELRYGNAATFS